MGNPRFFFRAGLAGLAAVLAVLLPLYRYAETLLGEAAPGAVEGLRWGFLLAAAALSSGFAWAMTRQRRREGGALRKLWSRWAHLAGEDAGAGLENLLATLDQRLQTLTHRLNEREAVLASMVEGVLAVDPGERLLDLNPAAAEMFGVNPGDVRGRTLIEAIRNPELQRFVEESLAGPGPVERELTLFGEGERYLQAHGTVLRDPDGQALGALLVLNDVTRLRTLERMRRDFVANVSHELKTPITSIKGYVETLLDGAPEDPRQARDFLLTVGRHADRLNAIIEDLLSLSRIEQEAEAGEIHTEPVLLAEVLDAAIHLCAVKADDKRIEVRLSCDPALRARINPPLIEQAVMNLVDNAVKYAPSGTGVSVEGRAKGDRVRITVRDEGPGIPPEHHPRLFERFYRVDRSRSRSEGGTGLGLAIVKHIAQAHGGRVEVENQPAAGCAFSLILPRIDLPGQ